MHRRIDRSGVALHCIQHRALFFLLIVGEEVH